MRPLGAAAAAAIRFGASITSVVGGSGALLVLTYHRVLPAPDPLLAGEPDAQQFASEMDVLKQAFTVIGLNEALSRLAASTLPRRAVAVTFDDGYANNLDVAAPILVTRGMTATFFVATGFLNGSVMWNDRVVDAVRQAPAEFDLNELGLGRFDLSDDAARRQAISSILDRLKYLEPTERARQADAIAEIAGARVCTSSMMSERQVRELARLGMEVGAHSITHPILRRLSPDVARREIVESRRNLEEVIGAPVRSFAYPNGRPGVDYGPEHVEMVRAAGYSAAVTTAWGAASRSTDPHQIPRVSPWDRTPGRYGLRLLYAFMQRRPQTT